MLITLATPSKVASKDTDGLCPKDPTSLFTVDMSADGKSNVSINEVDEWPEEQLLSILNLTFLKT